MDFYRSYDAANGYNNSPTAYSCRGVKHTEATKEKIRQFQLKRPPITEETRAKLSQSGKGHKGRVWTEEQRRAQAKLHLGRKHSEETKRKASEVRIGKTHWWGTASIKLFDANGKFVSEFKSIADAARATGTSKVNAYASCRTLSRLESGFYWRHSSAAGDSNVIPIPKFGRGKTRPK